MKTIGALSTATRSTGRKVTATASVPCASDFDQSPTLRLSVAAAGTVKRRIGTSWVQDPCGPPGFSPIALNWPTAQSITLVSPSVAGPRPENSSDETVLISSDKRCALIAPPATALCAFGLAMVGDEASNAASAATERVRGMVFMAELPGSGAST